MITAIFIQGQAALSRGISSSPESVPRRRSTSAASKKSAGSMAERVPGVAHGHHPVALGLQRHGQGFADVGLVVHNQNGQGCGHIIRRLVNGSSFSFG